MIQSVVAGTGHSGAGIGQLLSAPGPKSLTQIGTTKKLPSSHASVPSQKFAGSLADFVGLL
jgi:hypothetical protein